jgi:hypothetical protein
MRTTLAIVLTAGVLIFIGVPALATAEDKPAAEPGDPILDEPKDLGKPEMKPEPKAEPKPEPKAEPKPEPKAEPKPEPKAEQPAAQAQAKKPAPKEVSHRAARGLFLEANPGAFFTLGGEKGMSNAEPYVTAVFGWNFNADMALGLMLGFAANNNNAPKSEPDPTTGKKGPAKGYYGDYTVTFLDVNYSHYFGVSPRFAVPVRVFAGGSFIANRYDANDPTLKDKPASFQPNAGLASGIQYTTWQKHLTVGAELAFFYLITDAVPAISIYPAVKYNF